MQSKNFKIQTRPIEDLLGRIRTLRRQGQKEIRIPEEFHDVGKNIKINFTTENENIVTTTGKTEMNNIQLIQIYDTELWNKMANDNPVSMYMESI